MKLEDRAPYGPESRSCLCHAALLSPLSTTMLPVKCLWRLSHETLYILAVPLTSLFQIAQTSRHRIQSYAPLLLSNICGRHSMFLSVRLPQKAIVKTHALLSNWTETLCLVYHSTSLPFYIKKNSQGINMLVSPRTLNLFLPHLHLDITATLFQRPLSFLWAKNALLKPAKEPCMDRNHAGRQAMSVCRCLPNTQQHR